MAQSQLNLTACNKKVTGFHENCKRILAVLFLPLECSFLPFLFCCCHRMSAQIYCHCCHLANEYHEMQQALAPLCVTPRAGSLKSDSSPEVIRLAECSWNTNVTVRLVSQLICFFPQVKCTLQNYFASHTKVMAFKKYNLPSQKFSKRVYRCRQHPEIP